MVRSLRPDFVNTYHHVVIRGVDGLPLFDTPEKRQKFLEIIRETRQSHDLKIYAFGFMDDHWHALVRRVGIEMSRFFQTVKARYTIWYNKRYGRTGTAYDGRYFSSIVEVDSYFQMVWHYVQNQGVKAGIYQTAVEDPGSTAGLYAGLSDEYDWIDWREALKIMNLPVEQSVCKLAEQMNKMESPEKLPVRCQRQQHFIASDQYVEKYMQIRKKKVRSGQREESPVSWSKLLQGVRQLYGYEVELVLKPTKKRKLVDVRAGLAYAARRYGHKSTTEISLKLGVSTATVSRMIRKTIEQLKKIRMEWDLWIQSGKS